MVSKPMVSGEIRAVTTDFETSDSSAFIVLTERPPASVLMALHRALTLGVSDILRRIEAQAPIVRVELFGNDHLEVTARLQTVLDLIAPYRHEIYRCRRDTEPDTATRIDASRLRTTLLSTQKSLSHKVFRPIPDPTIARLIADAVRAAVTDLREQHFGRFTAFALLTTGEAHAPYLSAISTGTAADSDRWNFAESPFSIQGYEKHFGAVSAAWNAPESDSGVGGSTSCEEYVNRLSTMEEGFRLLDADGFFGTGADRERVLLLVGTLPPEVDDAGCVRRLNPRSELRDEWLRECAECPPIPTEFVASIETTGSEPSAAPNPSVAELWRAGDGVCLPDGTVIYGPHRIAERNKTNEVGEYSPGWVLVGDDSGGGGYLMRASGPAFDALSARSASEVFRLDVGALCGDIDTVGEFVTDDLIGWIARRSDS